MQPPIWKKFVNVSGFAERNRSAIADENRRLREEESAGIRAKSGIGTVRFDLGGGVYDERDAEELEDDPVYGGIATEALFKRELKNWRDQADSLDIELSDPSKQHVKRLTPQTRDEILREGKELTEDNPRHAELKQMLMDDEEIQAKEKAKWEAKKRLQELGQMGVNGFRQQRVQSRLSEAAKASQAISEQEQTIAAREAEGVKGRDLQAHAAEKAQVMQQKQVVETQKQSAAGAILEEPNEEAKKLAEWQSMKPDQRLAKKLQDSKLFSGITQSIGIASDKSLVRRPDGSWDTPAVVKQYDNQIFNAVKSGLTAVRAKAGLRGGGTAEETQAMNEALYQFQQENNLSDEEVVRAWNDFTARNNESWQDDEKLRVLSDGEIILNASAPEILDRQKLSKVIESANAPAEQKVRALENLEFTRKNVAEQRLMAYEAAGVGIESPSEYAARTGRGAGMLNDPDFILEYEQKVLGAEGEVAKKARGFAGDVVLGFNKLATTVLGAGAQLTNSETMGQLAAAGSEGGQVVGQGKPDTGIVGAVVQEAPSLAAMVVGAELIGAAGATAGVGATAMSWISRAGSLTMAGGQSLGATYADERAQGKTHEEAEEVALRSGINTAIITGVFNALPGMAGFEKYTGGAQKKVADVTMREILKSTSKQELAARVSKFARDKVLAGVSEGLEEGVDELTNAFINAEPDTNLSTAWKNAVEAAKVGALIGTAVDVVGSTGFGNREKINAAVVAAGGAEVTPEEERKLVEIAGEEVDPAVGSQHVLAMREIDEISADAPELALRASGSLKIARGMPLEELTSEEITALGVDRTGKPLGGETPAMVEMVNGRPILLDPAIRELETAAPSSKGLISMTEGEARQKFAKTKFTVTSKGGKTVEVEARNDQEAGEIAAKQFDLGDQVDTVTPLAATGGAAKGKTPTPIANTPAGAKPSQPVASQPAVAPGTTPPPSPAVAVVEKIRAKSKGMAKLITVSTDPATRVMATDAGITVNPDALMAEAVANGLDEKQAAEWVENVIDEEVRHMAQFRAAESLYKKSKSKLSLEAWRSQHYGAVWNTEFVATGKAEIVRKLYGEEVFDQLPEWKKAMEGIRMMWQQNESQSQTETAKLWTRVSDAVIAELKAVLEVLKSLAKDDALSPSMKRELALLQKKLKELETAPEKPAAKPAAETPPAPFTAGQRIEGTVHKEDPQFAGQKISGVIAQVTPSGTVLLVQADGIARPVRVLTADAKAVAVKPKEWEMFAHETGTLGIPRAEMPQIKAENRSAMVQFLKARGIDYNEETVMADTLKPTQAEYSPAKVQKARDYEGGNRAILVSEDGYVVDGHHQWLAADGGEIRVIRLMAPIQTVLDTVKEMPSVETAAPQTPQAGSSTPIELMTANEWAEANLSPAQINLMGTTANRDALLLPFYDATIDAIKAGRPVSEDAWKHATRYGIPSALEKKAYAYRWENGVYVSSAKKPESKPEAPAAADTPPATTNPQEVSSEPVVESQKPSPKKPKTVRIVPQPDGGIVAVDTTPEEIEFEVQSLRPGAPKETLKVPANPAPSVDTTLEEARKKARNVLDGLFAANLRTEEFNKAIPQDRFMQLMDAANSMLQAGINTPEALAAEMATLAPDRKAVPFTQRFWFALQAAGAQGAAEPDWAAIYNQLDTAGETGTLPTNENEPTSETDSESAQAGSGVERGAGESSVDSQPSSQDNRPGATEQLSQNGKGTGASGNTGAIRGNAARSGNGGRTGKSGSGNDTERGAEPSADGTDSVVAGDGTGMASGEQPTRTTGRPGYRITDPEKIIGSSGPKTRFNRNRLALETFDAVFSEERDPTPEELDKMAAYIGWGSFGQELFQGTWDRPNPKPEWQEESDWLRDHLGKEGWESIRDSIINAHYTDPPHVQALWRIVEHLGFKGGRVLEPSMGIGNFFGMMPDILRAKSSLTGIELDRVVGGMAQMLYPDANIRIMGYEKSATADNFYDLVIGNWPFAKDGPSDSRYNSYGLSLHDYFFVKALDQVRPGGLVIGITSSGTMDKKGQTARRQMAKRAELIGAFRLPTGAFEKYAGTKVVTDIVILKKRSTQITNVDAEGWINTEKFGTGDKSFNANEYWSKNPDRVLGTMRFGTGTTQGRAGMVVDRHDDYAEVLAKIEQSLPKGILEDAPARDESKVYQNRDESADQNSVVWNDGDAKMPAGFYIVRGEQLEPLESVFKWELKEEAKSEKRRAELKGLIEIRQNIQQLLMAQRTGEGDAKAIRAKAKSQYDAFVKKHGAIAKSTMIKALEKSGDPMALALKNLERFENGKYVPRDILMKDIMRRPETDAKGNIEDAYAIHRNNSTTLDIEAIAKLAEKPVEQVIARLVELDQIYQTPNGTWEAGEEYLGGNVRRKLREARDAQEQGIDMTRNIAALEAVQPKDVAYFEIEVQMGASWIPRADYIDYAAHLLSAKPEDFDLVKASSGWNFRVNNRSVANSTQATATWGTAEMSFSKVFQAALNGTTLKVYDPPDRDGVRAFNQKATELVNKKIDDIREELSNWLWSDPERTGRLVRDYNEVMNSEVVPKRNGSHLRLEGLTLNIGTSEFDFRQHQKDAVWRFIMDGRGLAAHEVGTGKTFTMAGLAVEGRRLGKFRKSIVFAHNANAESVYADFQLAYPGGKFLFIDNLSPENRDNAMRQIALDEWDAVVVPHSLIDRFALREETLMEIANKQIRQMESEIADALDELGVSDINIDDEKDVARKLKYVKDSHTAKELVKARSRIIKRIKDKAAKSHNEKGVFFEDLGVDSIMVDEAHIFKKIALATRKVVKGLNKTESERGWMLGALTDLVKSRNNGKGVFLFTGTPLTNNLNEAYNMMRFVMDDTMEEVGIDGFDDWFNSFAAAVTDVELTTGGTFEPVSRLLSFVNVPELARLAGRYFDVVQAKSMPEFVPRESPDGRTENAIGRPFKKIRPVTGEMSLEQKAHKNSIEERYRAFQKLEGKAKRDAMLNGVNTPIQLETEGIKSALDYRLVDPTAPDYENSKVNLMIRNAIDHYIEDETATQMIFMERGWNDYTDANVAVRDNEGKVRLNDEGKRITQKVRRPQFNLVRDMVEKLVSQGVKPEEIAIFSNMSLDPISVRPNDVLRKVNRVTGSVSKEDLAVQMREGKIRFAIGSTQTMGTGVNAQTHMRAMHHLDAPWTPGEFEQRNGRGHRQGNQWNTVYEYRYFTEGSHDGRRWQVLLNKVKFISRFVDMLIAAGGSNLRVLTGDGADLNEEGSNIADFEQSFSSAAGDPRILVRAKLRTDVEKLERKRDAHLQAIVRANRDIDDLRAKKRRDATSIEYAESLQDAYKVVKDLPFNVKVSGNTFEKRSDAEEFLAAFPSLTQKDDGKTILDFNGIKVIHYWLNNSSEPSRFKLSIDTSKGTQTLNIGNLSIASVEATLRGQARVLNNFKEEFSKIDAAIRSLQEMAQKPFTRDAELEAKKNALQQIEVELNRAPQPAPAWLRNGAPVGSLIYLADGKSYDVAAHRWDTNGWWILVEDENGMRPVDYRKALDDAGNPMFEEVVFVAPEKTGKEPAATNDNETLQTPEISPVREADNSAMEGWLFKSEKYRKTEGRVIALRRIESKLSARLDELKDVVTKYMSYNQLQSHGEKLDALETRVDGIRRQINEIESEKMRAAKSGKTDTSLQAAQLTSNNDIDSPAYLGLDLQPYERPAKPDDSASDRKQAEYVALTAFEQAAEKAGGSNIKFFTLRDNATTDEDGRNDTLRRGILSFVKSFEQAFGKTVVFFDSGKSVPYGLSFPVTPNFIAINVNAPASVTYLLGHELGHVIKSQDRKLYDAFQRDVLALAKGKEGYSEMIEKRGYAADKIDDEMFNDIIGNLFARDSRLWQELAAKDTTGAFTKIAATAVRIINKMINGLRKLNQRDTTELIEDELIAVRKNIAGMLNLYRERGNSNREIVYRENATPDASPKFLKASDYDSLFAAPLAPRSVTDDVDAIREKFVETAKREILNDMASGDIPASVRSFEELNDYVDANEYVNDANREDRSLGPYGKSKGWKTQDFIDFTNGVIDELNDWLASGDAAYLSAVEAGDMETAQRMVDEAAKAAGYDEKAYHGTPTGGFTVFDKELRGRSGGRSRGGFSFTNNKAGAESYAKAFTSDTVALDNAITTANRAIRKAMRNPKVAAYFEDEGYEEDTFEFSWEAIDSNEDFADTLTIYAKDLASIDKELSDAFYQAAAETVSSAKIALDRGLKTAQEAAVKHIEDPATIDFFREEGWTIDPRYFESNFIDMAPEEVAESLRDFARNLRSVNHDLAAEFVKAASQIADVKSNAEVKNVFLRIPENARKFKATPETLGEVVFGLNVSEEPSGAAVVEMPGGEKVLYVAEPEQIKSADPVTRDEQGNVIPLSQRFNPASDSILYAANLNGMNPDRVKEAMAQQEEFGNAVKPPNRASMGDETTRKAVDVFDIEYEERRERETRKQWVEGGTERARTNRKALIENAKANAYGEVGAVPLTPEDIVGTQIIIEQMVKEAGNDFDKLIEAGTVIQAYRTMRSNVARVLASGWDRLMKPEERNRRFLANAILTLPPKVAAQIARKQLTPEQSKIEIRRELQERLTKIEKALKEYGVTINEVLGKQVYVSLDKKNVVKDIMKDATKDEALAIRMHQQHADAAKIAKTCHMTVAEVEKLVKKVYDEALQRMIEKARAGMTLETSGLQAASLLTEEQIIAEARRMVEVGLGLSPTVHTPSTRALARKAKIKVESEPEKINWSRPEFTSGLLSYTFDSKDLAEIKRTSQALIDATAATAKVETLTGKKRQEAEAMLAKLESILAKYGTSVQQVVESGKPLESYRFDITDRVHVHLIANAIRSVDADAIDKGVEWYYFSMLSGLQTMMVNASSVVHGIFDATIGRGAEMILNAFLRNPMNASLGETKYILKAMGPMMSRARSNFAASFGAETPFFEQDILGVPPDLESVLEGHGMYHRTAISGKKGQFIRIPTRILLATDEFVKTINAMTEVGAMAYRICRAGDLKPGTKEFDDKMKELVNIPGSLAWQMAASKAYNRTFTNALPGQKDLATGKTRDTRTVGEVFGGIVGKTQGLLQSGPSDTMTAKLGKTLLRLMFFPFVKVPYNITALAMTYTPLSLIDIATLYAQSRGIKGKAEKQKAQAEVIERMSRVMIGGIVAGFMLGAGEGDDDDLDKPLLITGSRPYKDTKKGVRELGQRMGVDAYSISWKLPNGKRGVFHYGRVEPIATVLATTIDTMRELKQAGRGRQDYGEAMTKAVSSFTNQLSDKTFLKGIGDAYKTVMGEQNMSKFVADKLAMAVPNLIKQPIRETDPYFRDKADTFGEELLSAIYPSGIREPKVDIYGEKSTKLGNSLTRIFDFTDAGTVAVRKVDEMLWRYQQKNPDASGIPTIASDKYTPVTGEGQKEMTEKQARMYRERAGQNLTNMLKSRTFNYENPTERDIDNLNKLIEAARKSAKTALKYDPNWK